MKILSDTGYTISLIVEGDAILKKTEHRDQIGHKIEQPT